MRSGRNIIGHSRVSRPGIIGDLHNLQQLAGTVCNLIGQPRNLDTVILILHDVQSLFVVQQVQTSSTVNFEKTHTYETATIYNAEKLIHHRFLKPVHRKSLARASLPIGEASHDPFVGQKWNQWLQRVLVKILSVLLLIESIVKSELMVLHVLGYAIHSVLGLVNLDLRVG